MHRRHRDVEQSTSQANLFSSTKEQTRTPRRNQGRAPFEPTLASGRSVARSRVPLWLAARHQEPDGRRRPLPVTGTTRDAPDCDSQAGASRCSSRTPRARSGTRRRRFGSAMSRTVRRQTQPRVQAWRTRSELPCSPARRLLRCCRWRRGTRSSWAAAPLASAQRSSSERCRRRVVVYDDDSARNRVSRGIHGFVSHDGIPPDEFRRRAHAELATYGVEIRSGRIVEAVCIDEASRSARCPGARRPPASCCSPRAFKTSCPRCRAHASSTVADCFRWRLLRRVGVPRSAPRRVRFRRFCCRVHAGPHDLEPRRRPVHERRATPGGRTRRDSSATRSRCVESASTRLQEATAGSRRSCSRMASGCLATRSLHLGQRGAAPPLAARLGCKFEEGGPVRTFEKQTTDVVGLYLAGDAAQDGEVRDRGGGARRPSCSRNQPGSARGRYALTAHFPRAARAL